jgi:hypothetical protein
MRIEVTRPHIAAGTRRSSIHCPVASALKEATGKWVEVPDPGREERARRCLNMVPPPAKRLAEVSDIAETIINTLLPDGEDDRRDLIADDYQLQSDIETFEQLTGKVIQPGDDLPVVGDEITWRTSNGHFERASALTRFRHRGRPSFTRCVALYGAV